MGRRLTTGHGFEDVPLDWLRSKPGAKWHRHPGEMGAWIADMDFRPPDFVVDSVRHVLEVGDLGYPDWRPLTGGSPVVAAFVDRCQRRWGWSIDGRDVRELGNVVQAIQLVLHVATQPGDRVVVHTPAYPPFLRSVEQTGREIVRVPARRDESSTSGWHFDHEALDAELRRRPARAMLLCHPHNPTGHVWSTDDLVALADIAERHDLLVVSDEIWADLVYEPNVHRPFGAILPHRTITVTAASKTFNIAGLRCAVAHVGDRRVAEAMRTLPHDLLGEPNLAGVAATTAAWTAGDEWVGHLVAHLDRQRLLLRELLAEALPDVTYVPPSSTYVAWLDCRALGFGDDPSEEFARRGVRLNDGPSFGVEGRGFARLNMATSSSVLRELVRRMSTPRP